MDSAGFKTRVGVMLGNLSSNMTDDIYSVAESIALDELGWAVPTDDSFQIIWIAKRIRRHAIDIFYVQAAESVTHKSTKLDQKFDHYASMIENMDKEFSNAMEQYMDKFANVDPTKIFGTYVNCAKERSVILRMLDKPC